MALEISIIDYGMGNIGSVANALGFLGCHSEIVSSPEEIISGAAFILPGVGAFGEAADRLRTNGLSEALHRRVVVDQAPLLGICLGMQLLARSSEESADVSGLGWIKGGIIRLPEIPGISVPHVGWNNVTSVRENALFRDIAPDSEFYFDHSYHLSDSDVTITGTTSFGAASIAASVESENILAVQFHPEKSQTAGLRLLRNFLNFANERVPAC